jgi:hypothetical protein
LSMLTSSACAAGVIPGFSAALPGSRSSETGPAFGGCNGSK